MKECCWLAATVAVSITGKSPAAASSCCAEIGLNLDTKNPFKLHFLYNFHIIQAWDGKDEVIPDRLIPKTTGNQAFLTILPTRDFVIIFTEKSGLEAPVGKIPGRSEHKIGLPRTATHPSTQAHKFQNKNHSYNKIGIKNPKSLTFPSPSGPPLALGFRVGTQRIGTMKYGNHQLSNALSHAWIHPVEGLHPYSLQLK